MEGGQNLVFASKFMSTIVSFSNEIKKREKMLKLMMRNACLVAIINSEIC